MATKGKQEAAPAKSAGKKINRARRNSMMRKSLPKFLKTMFSGSDHSTFRSVEAAWKESRKKVSSGGMGRGD